MRISDTYNRLEERELYMGQEEILNGSGERLEASEKERVLRRTMERIGKETLDGVRMETGRKNRGKKKIGLLILAAVLLMGATVSAAEHLKWNKNFLEFFGISSDRDQEELKSLAIDLEQSEHTAGKTEDENQGVTIRASQAVSDGETVYIYFDIALPDGIYKESDDEKTRIVRFRKNTYRMGENGNEAIGGMVIRKSEDGSEQYYAIGELAVDTIGSGRRELTMHFENLGYIEADDTSTNWVNLIRGEWTLDWNLEYQDGARNYPVSKTFAVENGAVEVQNIRLSPFGVKLTVVTADPENVSFDPVFIDGIIMEDGSCQELLEVERVEPEDGKLTIGGTFRKMVDMDRIKGVRLCGEELLFK